MVSRHVGWLTVMPHGLEESDGVDDSSASEIVDERINGAVGIKPTAPLN